MFSRSAAPCNSCRDSALPLVGNKLKNNWLFSLQWISDKGVEGTRLLSRCHRKSKISGPNGNDDDNDDDDNDDDDNDDDDNGDDNNDDADDDTIAAATQRVDEA